jgi:hypothetical protein
MPRYKFVPVRSPPQSWPTKERSQLKRKRPPINATGPRLKRRRPNAEELRHAADSLVHHSKSETEETSDSPRSDQSDESYSMSKQEAGASDQESFEKEPEFEFSERVYSDPKSPGIQEDAEGRRHGRGAAAAPERRPARQQPDTPPGTHMTNLPQNAAPAPTPIRHRRSRLHAQVRAKKKAPSTKSNYGGAYRAF